MKILFVAHSFIPHTFAGTEIYTHLLAKELAREDEVAVFFRIKNLREKEYSLTKSHRDGFETFAINRTFNQCRCFNQTYSDSQVDKVFAGLLDKIMPDCVHIQHLLFLSLGIVKEAKKRRLPVIFTLNDYWLMCPRGQLIREDLEVCPSYNFELCRECLLSQLAINGNSLRYYNLMREFLSPFFVQKIKKAYLCLVNRNSPVRDFDYLLQGRLMAVKEIISQVDIFIAPSNFLREKFIAFGIPEHKIRHIPYGHELNRKDVQRIPSSKFRFGFVGTILPMKGLDYLIDAFQNIKSSEVELLIFGKFYPYAGYESYPKVLKKKASSDKRIKFKGGFHHKDLSEVFSQIDCLVVPSLWPENSPLVITEAFMHKVPVIAFGVGGVPELVKNGENGILVNPRDTEGLKNAMEKIYKEVFWRRGIISNPCSVKSIREHAEELKKLYQDFIYKQDEDKNNTYPIN